ncbi:MAG: hypothetical protein CMB67_01145 [Euryarchaeota archaeon]|nr:hypothetical protein [Euryarchaeota archaeon]
MGNTSRSPTHRLSPSSWNRFEECPRKYWLSRQGLPKKASMPASMGTAIHNSVEDLCNLDLTVEDTEPGWLEFTSKEALDRNWKIERDLFLDTPRHPRWKPELITKAHEGLRGALQILLKKARITQRKLSDVTVGCWKKVQGIVLANEGTLESSCGRVMGRLDLWIAESKDGESEKWIVADLKTGRPPKDSLDAKVSRQLRLYRDLLKQNNPDHPPVHAEGWYSANQTVHRADGPPILDEALEAWEMMAPTEYPPDATPSDAACAFCEWKAWCPKWWVARRDGEISPGSMFRDEVVRLVRFDKDSGATLFERSPPVGNDGELAPSDHRFGAILKDKAHEKMIEIQSSGGNPHLFLGSARVDGKIMHLGDWSEILPWSPMLRSST